ncbi:MAG: hypothetical protein QXI39_07555 [Candidatus Bathyarchaeia archaeon]
MNPHDRLVLVKEVSRLLGAENDSVYIVPLCDRCLRLCKIISSSGHVSVTDSEVEIVT